MGSTFEQLILEVITKDRASPGLDRIGLSAGDAAGNVDTLSRRLSEVGNKSATARVGLEGNKEAQAALDRIDAKLVTLDRRTANPNISVEGAARAAAELAAIDLELDKIGAKGGSASGAEGALTGLAGTNVSGMGALIAGGAVLSPMLVTLGIGLGGVAAAAYGVAKPIEAAAKKAGGLQANLAMLDPEQRQVALGLLALKGEFGSFEKAIQPQVLGIFNDGLRLAGHLLSDAEPVARATAGALGGVLTAVDKEFQSGEWKSFFSWMAQQAGPDLQQLGALFVGLLHDLPPLVQGLQPLASGLIGVATDATKVLGVANELHVSLPLLGVTIGAMAGGPIGALIGGLTGVSLELSKVHTSVDATIPSWTKSTQATTEAVVSLRAYGPQIASYIEWLHKSGQAGRDTADVQKQFAAMTAKAATQTGAAGAAALVAGPKFFSLNKAVAALNTSMTKLVGNLLTLQGSELSWKQALQAAETQVKSNTAGLAGNSKNALANKQAVLQSTQAALNFAGQQLQLGKNIDGADRTVQRQIGWLQSLHDHSKFVQDEIHALRLEEQKLQAQQVNQMIHVQGLGQWQVSQSLSPGVGHRRAAGGLIPGSGSGDTYPALLTPGELVVPKGMVKAGAVDHLRGRLPGFAAGGIVPSYSGPVAGMPPWVKGNDAATIRLIDQAVVKATVAGMRAAAAAAQSSPGFGITPSGPLQSYARSLLAAYGWANQWPQFNDIVMRESGWNVHATNPSSGAYGIPQALPPGKMASAGADWATNGFTQLRWMMGYLRSRWGSPANADANEISQHWYDNGGWLHPGMTLAVNNTGQPERVLPPGRGHDGPLVQFGDVNVYNETDEAVVRQRLSFAITAAGLGS